MKLMVVVKGVAKFSDSLLVNLIYTLPAHAGHGGKQLKSLRLARAARRQAGAGAEFITAQQRERDGLLTLGCEMGVMCCGGASHVWKSEGDVVCVFVRHGCLRCGSGVTQLRGGAAALPRVVCEGLASVVGRG